MNPVIRKLGPGAGGAAVGGANAADAEAADPGAGDAGPGVPGAWASASETKTPRSANTARARTNSILFAARPALTRCKDCRARPRSCDAEHTTKARTSIRVMTVSPPLRASSFVHRRPGKDANRARAA